MEHAEKSEKGGSPVETRDITQNESQKGWQLKRTGFCRMEAQSQRGE